MVGRKPKPTKLKLLEGNRGHRPIIKNEPQPDSTIPQCPEWLLDYAKEEWNRIAPELGILGLLTNVDMGAFAGYCQAFAKWKKADEFIKKHGTTYKIPKTDKDGKVVSIYMAQFPEVSIASTSLSQMVGLCADFGLTPSSRGRMSLPSGKEDVDPMEKLFNQKKIQKRA